jgi:hypothetical protein
VNPRKEIIALMEHSAAASRLNRKSGELRAEQPSREI